MKKLYYYIPEFGEMIQYANVLHDVEDNEIENQSLLEVHVGRVAKEAWEKSGEHILPFIDDFTVVLLTNKKLLFEVEGEEPPFLATVKEIGRYKVNVRFEPVFEVERERVKHENK